MNKKINKEIQDQEENKTGVCFRVIGGGGST